MVHCEGSKLKVTLRPLTETPILLHNEDMAAWWKTQGCVLDQNQDRVYQKCCNWKHLDRHPKARDIFHIISTHCYLHWLQFEAPRPWVCLGVKVYHVGHGYPVDIVKSLDCMISRIHRGHTKYLRSTQSQIWKNQYVCIHQENGN